MRRVVKHESGDKSLIVSCRRKTASCLTQDLESFILQDMIAMCGPLIALVNKEVQRDMKCYVRTTADLSIENILAQMHLHFRLAVGLLEDDFRWQRRHLLAMHQARGSCRHSRRGRDPSPRTGADCRSARARAGRRSTEDPASRGAHGARRRRAEGKPT